MKITCDSCQAKYTIADEKVVGKIVKIKCKKCGTTIVVNGNDAAANGGLAEAHAHANGGAAGGADDEWTVNVSDDDQRTMSTQQLVDDYGRGVLNADTYVWRDGMADWLPISDVAELSGRLGAGASAPTPLGLGGTSVMGNAGPALSPFAAPRAAASPFTSSPAPTAARRSGARGGAGVDVFGAAAEQASAPDSQAGPDRAVGERNENSVLFSLSALTATENAMKAQAGRSTEEASIDFGRPPAPRNGGGSGRSGFDDIMNLGGGMGGGLSSPMLAPPPLNAPVIEAPPPPPSVSAMPPSMGQPMMHYAPPPPKSKTGLIVGILLGMGVLAAAAVFLTSSPKPEPTASTPEAPVAAQQQTAAPPPAETVVAAPPPVDTSQAAAPSGDPASTGAVAAGAVPGGRPGGPVPAGGKPKEEPKTEPKAEPKAEAKPAETAAPAAGGNKEFNRGAASAALGGAAGAARSCKKGDGPTGSGKVKVTFAPSGNVTSASVVGAPFAGTSVGGCVASAFRSAKVPPFDGSPVSVTKSFSIN